MCAEVAGSSEPLLKDDSPALASSSPRRGTNLRDNVQAILDEKERLTTDESWLCVVLLEALDAIVRLEAENERMRDLAVRQGWVDVSGKPHDHERYCCTEHDTHAMPHVRCILR